MLQRQSGEVPRWIRSPPNSLLRTCKNAWAEYIRIRNEVGGRHERTIEAWETNSEKLTRSVEFLYIRSPEGHILLLSLKFFFFH